MARVTWFEIHADDVERATEFYKKAFGWKANKWRGPMEYMILTTGDSKTPGIDGAIMPRMGANSVWNTVSVDNVDEAVKKIEKAGGRIVFPKREIPKQGWIAYCMDTEGNVFGVMQSIPSTMM